MIKYTYKTIIIILTILLSNSIYGQQNNIQLLKRDSLDFTNNTLNINSGNNEFNPIPYKGGFLFVSNKKTNNNPLGFNKVYWIASNEFGSYKGDSLIISKNIKLNDDFTAPTSNDNDILTRYSKRRKNNLNPIESNFEEFNPNQAFTISEATNTLIYPKLSNNKINGKRYWELWKSVIKNGKLKENIKIDIIDSAADYLYPSLSKDGQKLFFSSNRKNGNGGFDIYFIENNNGQWSNLPKALFDVNTPYEEIYPYVHEDTLFYASNKDGGLGGFDIYKNIKGVSINLGYPNNTSFDDFSYLSVGISSFITSNRNGNADIVSLNYNPIQIPLTGSIGFVSDTSVFGGQVVYIFDKDENKLIDSFLSDKSGQFNYNTKPNRNLVVKIKNTDGLVEDFVLQTNDKTKSKINFVTKLKSRSPKQISDSLYVIAENKKNDSLSSYSLGNKFVIYYDFDKYIVRQKEQNILDSLLRKLVKMPSANIVIGAFTDCVGSYKYNYKLSVHRAKSVVSYLLSKGLSKDRIVSNGYSKKYTITPCIIRTNKLEQQVNRRAEIVLSDQKNATWADLERMRGVDFYTVYSNYPKKHSKANSIVNKIDIDRKYNQNVIKKDTIVKVVKPLIVKKDSIAKVVKPLMVKKDTIVKVIPPMTVKKDTITKVVKSVVVKKDTIVKVTLPVFVKKDTVVKVIVAKASDYQDELSKEEILKALDSLATLKKEQERIVEYMTKRINKKPIDVFVSSDSVSIEIYDNGIHDKDSVSVIYNNRIVVDKQELKVRKPITFKLKVDKNKKYNELVMVAENLGSEPPNTAVMFVTEKSGRRQQVMLATDMTHNELVYFIRIGKE